MVFTFSKQKTRRVVILSDYGFTLIELMVVIAVMGMLSVIGILTLVDYSKTQQLNTETLSVATALRRAKSRALSQVKPSSCVTDLQGYKVVFCTTTNCKTYQTYAVCGTDIIDGPQQTLAGPVVFGAIPPPSIFFRVLTEKADPGTVQINNGTLIKTITIDALGGVSVH